MLVYIPYFVLPTDCHSHLVLTSGVITADMVFVQNEHIRQNYINTLSIGIDKNILKEKIIAVGSPKTDKIINARISNYKIPELWKETAGERKVIFFNTNISMLLNNPDHVIENLERIFNIVNSAKTFCLLWREHPLTEATLDSMLPELRTEYHNLRNRFVAEKWGILDDSPDPYPAMLFSDCYYGAGGSLSAIYPITGKPIMITDYKYPEQISPEPISLKVFKKSFSRRMLYTERNINSLSLFLENLSVFEAQKDERIKSQSFRMDNLDGSVGLKIHKKVKYKLL